MYSRERSLIKKVFITTLLSELYIQRLRLLRFAVTTCSDTRARARTYARTSLPTSEKVSPYLSNLVVCSNLWLAAICLNLNPDNWV